MSEAIKCFCVEKIERATEDAPGKWRRTDTNDIIEAHSFYDLPVGAIFDATWLHDASEWTGPDGKSMVVMTPGGPWMIDSRASNCGLPQDNVHKCWVRHGEAPDLTVDKNGNTCNAGAGSILKGGYHGYLRSGFLQPA